MTKSPACLFRVVFCILALHSVNATAADDAPAAKRSTLRGTIIDAETQAPLPARVSIQSRQGAWYFPQSAAPGGSAIAYKRQVGPTSLEQHVTVSADPFMVELPFGDYTIRVERGKEYVPLVQDIHVDRDAVDISLPIRRWINLAKAGWYSGDVHAHRPLAEVPNLILAEDLNVALPLSNWVTASTTGPIAGNRIEGTMPAPEWIAVDATHGIYPRNTEYEIFTVGGKPQTLGAVLVLGQKSTPDVGVPPVRRIAELAHRDGAFLDLEKHSWNWTPMIVPIMKPELFELANNHVWPSDFAFHSWTLDMAAKSMALEMNDKGFTEWGWIEFGLKSYYAYLNCGFRMMPSAGTGSGVHPVPLGFSRVYVHVDGDFTYQKWRDGLLAGHSFMTTGPLMNLTCNGQLFGGQSIPGDMGGKEIRFGGTISSLHPIDRIEVIVDGIVEKTIAGTANVKRDEPVTETFHESVKIYGSHWLAIRCFEKRPDGRIRFAHSAPVFVEFADERQQPFRDEVEHFIERIEREVARNESILDAASLDEYREALAIYRNLLKRARPRPKSVL